MAAIIIVYVQVRSEISTKHQEEEIISELEKKKKKEAEKKVSAPSDEEVVFKSKMGKIYFTV